MNIRILGLALWCMHTFCLAQEKKLGIADYGKWNRIVGATISPDGNWASYGLRPNGGDDTLFVKQLNGEKVYKIKFAASASFSEDGKWVSYLISPSKEESKKLREARKDIFNTAEILHLATGEKQRFERVDQVAFSTTSDHFAVLRKKHPDDKTKHQGKDLIVKNLKDGVLLNIGNVSHFAFNQEGHRLAYTVDADGMAGNGLYLIDLASNGIQALDTDSAHYGSPTWDDKHAHRRDWDKKGRHIAVLKGHAPDSLVHRDNSLLVLSDVGMKNQGKKVFDKKTFAAWPTGMVMSVDGDLRWSEDGTLVFFGIRAQEEKVKLGKDTVPNVDVWHWKDETIQTVQMRRANMEKRFTYLCAVSPVSGTFARLADDSLRNVLLSRHSRYAVGRNEKPYLNDVSWGETFVDLYRIDLKTGEKQLFANKVARPLGYSPDGRYYLFQSGDHLHVYDLEGNKLTNVSKPAPVNFADIDHPYPNEKPPYGLAGWTKDGKHVVVNHKYDLWSLALDGSRASNLTAGLGDAEEIQFRYAPIDPLEEYIDTNSPLLLAAYGEWTKKSGYYTVAAGQKPKVLVYEDRSFGRPVKALHADQVLYTIQTFRDFPDYYVSNSAFSTPHKVTDANPQQKEYAWGNRVLVDYENSKGQKLQATLTLPANYKEGDKYPMIVYFYEKMSQNHHMYSMPVYDDRPHMSLYASNGYLVLMPDNVYEEGRPGTSSLDCISSAVQKVIDLGYADAKKVGLQGHSWGGYQSSFILTQTNIFACVVTGAPPTNLESFYNNIYGSTGTNHHGIMEIGQLRMGRNATPWSSREAYQRESPMVHAPNIKTPFLLLHGTEDGAVDWGQGLEFYNAARRLGKEVIFLSYPGEGHHLNNEANQKDFLLRMQQYFDHYLKDAEAPEWMKSGVPHLQKLYDKAG